MLDWLIDYVANHSARHRSCPLCGNTNHRNVEHRFFCCSGVAQQRTRWHNALLTAADSPLEALQSPKNFRISLMFVSQVALALSQPAQTAGGFEGSIGKGVPIVPKGPVVPFHKAAPGPIVPLTKVTGFKSAAKWMAMKKKKKNPLGFRGKAKRMTVSAQPMMCGHSWRAYTRRRSDRAFQMQAVTMQVQGGRADSALKKAHRRPGYTA